MSAVLRSTFNGAARASTRASSVGKFQRSFTAAARVAQREVIAESTVPVSSFTKNGGAAPERYEIPVTNAADFQRTITPLSKAVRDTMPQTMKKFTLTDKVVVVTGGARGLGNNMARACIEAGAKALVIIDANQELGDAAAAELYNATGIPTVFYAVDVRDDNAVHSAIQGATEKFGAPDVLINSAGIADSNIPAENYDLAMFRRLIDINLNGSFTVSQAVGKAMMAANKSGSIVLVASMSGSIVNYPQEQSAYNASKAGVIQLSKSLAAEWAKYGIRVNTISPGYMDTALNNVPALDAQKAIWKDRTPQGRLGAVDDLNGLAVFLASDSSSFMTGADVLIDGGYTLW